MKTTKKQRKALHRSLTRAGIPRHVDGNRLGLRKRILLAKEEQREEARRVEDEAYAEHTAIY